MSGVHRMAGLWVAGWLITLAACNEKPSGHAPPEAPKPSAAVATASVGASAEAPPPAPGGVKNVPREATLDVDPAASKLVWTDRDVTEADDAQFGKVKATLGIQDSKPASLSFEFQSSSLSVKDKPELAKRAKASSLDAANNAKGSFVSKSVTPSSAPNEYVVEGEITFRMTTKPVTFPVTVQAEGTGFHVKGAMSLVGANFGASGKLGLQLDMVFPFPN